MTGAVCTVALNKGFCWWSYHDNDEKVASSKEHILNLRLERKNHTLLNNNNNNNNNNDNNNNKNSNNNKDFISSISTKVALHLLMY